jgi:hypothetical protein
MDRDTRDMRERRDPKFVVRSSETLELRTSNPRVSLVSPVPPVLHGYPAGVVCSCPRRAGHRSAAVPKWFSLSLLESGYQGLDRQRRTTLGSIIHEHVRALSLGHYLLN